MTRVRPEPSDTDECACCGYTKRPLPLTAYEKWNRGQDQLTWIFLCEVCASTFLSKCVMHPHLVHHHLLFSSIGWIANEILQRLPEPGVDVEAETDVE